MGVGRTVGVKSTGKGVGESVGDGEGVRDVVGVGEMAPVAGRAMVLVAVAVDAENICGVETAGLSGRQPNRNPIKRKQPVLAAENRMRGFYQEADGNGQI